MSARLFALLEQVFEAGQRCPSCPHLRLRDDFRGSYYERMQADGSDFVCGLMESDRADPRDCPGVVDDKDDDDNDDDEEADR